MKFNKEEQIEQLPLLLTEKKSRLETIIARQDKAAVACSGGVDSTLLLKIACDVLGPENIIAVFAETPLLPTGEAEAARKIIQQIGSRMLTIGFNPLDWPEFTSNPENRCYLCKKKIYTAFLQKLLKLNFHVLMDGTNLDDLGDHRPGLKALRELKVITPLADAGLTKGEIRQLSRHLGLQAWNKHSSSCLATRISSGQQINKEKLDIIKKCEDALADLGFEGSRVRMAGDSALIELQDKDIEKFVATGARPAVLKTLNNFNIKKIFLDLYGRSEKCV